VGHILAPLMRLGVGRRAYTSAYGCRTHYSFVLEIELLAKAQRRRPNALLLSMTRRG
jgi:hypothetical protein